MQLRTLGGLRLDGLSFSRPKPLLLLAYLSLEGPKHRLFLRELFFPSSRDPADALATTLRRMRNAGLVSEQAEEVSAAVGSDAAQLLELLDAGSVEAALSLYEGAFLLGLDVGLEPEVEEWVYSSREFIANRVRRTILRAAEASLAAGAEADALVRVDAALAVAGAPEPNPDDLVRMLHLYGDHGSSNAAKVRQQAEKLSIRTSRLADRVPKPTPSKPAVTQPLPVQLTSLIGRDEELVEVADLLHSRSCRLLNLHGPAGVGKTRIALQAASDQLLTGAFPAGAVFVPVDAVTSVKQLPTVIAGHLGTPLGDRADAWQELANSLRERELLVVLDGIEHLVNRPSSQTTLATALHELLVACPSLKLLVTSQQRLNMTAEWVLPIAGLRVPSNSLSFQDAILCDAAQLFLRRSQAANLKFQLTEADLPYVRRICAAVDGFPLGIELAAALARSIPMVDVAESLENDLRIIGPLHMDASARNPTLWAALEQSWRHLNEAERTDLAKLSVFRGGFRREAAGYVAQTTIPMLVTLADKSQLRMDTDGRFSQHGLLAQFAREKLSGMEDLFRTTSFRHAEYYARRLEEVSGGETSGDLHSAYLLLLREEANLLAGLEWATQHTHVETLLALSEPLLWYFASAGRFRTGDRIFGSVLESLSGSVDDLPGDAPSSTAQPVSGSPTAELAEAKASLVIGRAWLNRYAGSLKEASRLGARAEQMARAAGSQLQLLRALDLRGQALTYEGEFEAARRHFQEGIELAQSHDDPLRLSRIRCNGAMVEALVGEAAKAEALLTAAEQPFTDGSLPPGIDAVAIRLARGVNAWCSADHAAGEAALRSAIRLARTLDYAGPLPLLKALLGATLLARGDSADRPEHSEEAMSLLDTGLQAVQASQEVMATSLLNVLASDFRLRQGDAKGAVAAATTAFELASNAGNGVIAMWSVPQLARSLAAAGETDRALRHLRISGSHRASPTWVREAAAGMELELAGEGIGGLRFD